MFVASWWNRLIFLLLTLLDCSGANYLKIISVWFCPICQSARIGVSFLPQLWKIDSFRQWSINITIPCKSSLRQRVTIGKGNVSIESYSISERPWQGHDIFYLTHSHRPSTLILTLIINFVKILIITVNHSFGQSNYQSS